MTPQASDTRVSPHNLDAERSVLGAILINAETFSHAAEVLHAGDFFRDAHQRIFGKMAALHARQNAIDFVTLKAELGRSNELEEIGGPAYLASLSDGVPSTANVVHYAAIVKAAAQARTVIAYARQAIDQFTADPSALGNGAGTRFADAIRRTVDEAHGGATKAVAPLLDDVEVINRPDPGWAVTDRIPAVGSVCVYGEPSIGKTAVAVGGACSVATGLPWLGAGIERKGPVVYQFGEGAASAGKRIGAWKIAHGVPLEQRIGVHIWDGPLNLLSPADVDRFIAAIQPIEPVQVVLDTWARGLLGGDENSARDTGLGVASVDRIARAINGNVWVLHHSNRANSGERGSGALRGAMDTMIAMVSVDDVLRLTCDKQKDGERFGSLDVKLLPVDGANACVVRLASDVLPSRALSDAQGRLLHALREMFQADGASSPDWQRALPGVNERTFYRAKKRLIDLGYVRDGKKCAWTGKVPPAHVSTAHSTDTD